MHPSPDISLADWRAGLTSRSAEETMALAGNFLRHFPANTALALHGDLGAGKTTFVQGLARALGITTPVTSPTYAIFSTYDSPSRQLVHMDAYRLGDPSEADELVLWDLLREPWTLVVEWPEKLGDRLPEGAWHLHLHIAADRNHFLRLIDCPSV